MMLEKEFEASAELAEKLREKGWKKEYSFLFSVFFLLKDELLKNLAICTS